ncbi:MAG: HAD-IB family phosphatase [Acidimicrobiia bacterium]
MHVDVDLAHASIFLDFDGTITTLDVGDHVADRLAPPSWRELDARYLAGEIGSRECLLDLWDLLPHDEARVRAVAREVPVDPGLGPLVESLRAAGAEVAVVSDGFGFTVEEVCAPLGLTCFTNLVDWSTGRLEFPHESRCCPCSTCGTCKQAPIKDARHRGRTTVLVGDGASDRKAALLADVVFAKGPLAEWCERNGVARRPFATLDDVRAALMPS